ncbi:hypothetical protein EJB05_01507, partial [Eragrostis curvula]
MGRGRGLVEVRWIENAVRRQLTFSKRRRGLAKKASELVVLCDANVALLVFSDKGRLDDFAAHTSMEQILDRYERYLLSEAGDVMQEHPELQVGRDNPGARVHMLMAVIFMVQESHGGATGHPDTKIAVGTEEHPGEGHGLQSQASIPSDIDKLHHLQSHSMAKQQLLLVAVVASVLLNAVDVSATAYDVLVKNNLPQGLLPKGVQSYVLKPDGKLEVTLPSVCAVAVASGGQQYKIQFSRNIFGVIQPGSISELHGMSLNVKYAWIGISKIERAGDQITLTVQNSRLPFPVSSFTQSPSCS